MSEDERTLLNVKLTAGRTARELAALAVIIAIGAAFLGAVFAAKILACKHERPGATAAQCLAPPGEGQ